MAAGLNLGNHVTLAQANAQKLPYPIVTLRLSWATVCSITL